MHLETEPAVLEVTAPVCFPTLILRLPQAARAERLRMLLRRSTHCAARIALCVAVSPGSCECRLEKVLLRWWCVHAALRSAAAAQDSRRQPASLTAGPTSLLILGLAVPW